MYRANVIEHSGIYGVHPDGSGLREVTPIDGAVDTGYEFPQPSPDGRLLSYTTWNPTFGIHQIHVLDLITGNERLFAEEDREDIGFATFSPDSTRIVYVKVRDGHHQVMSAPVADSTAAVAVGPNYRQVDGQYVTATFSPDGKWLIVSDPVSRETRLVDPVTGGAGELLSWSTGNVSGWQRIAP